MNEIINVMNFNFSYGSHQVLNGLNFTAQKGEVVGLLGENGSGKTTFLNSLCGFNGKQNSIEVLGTIPTLDNDSIKQNISYILDTPNLLDYLTAHQYLDFLLKVENIKYKSVEDDIIMLLKSFDIESEYDTKLLKNYSFGMKKKIQIIGELILRKPLLIIDEPTNGLDIKMIILLKNLLKKQNKDFNSTIIVSSHNASFLEDVCGRVVLFGEKKIVKNIVMEKDVDLEYEFNLLN